MTTHQATINHLNDLAPLFDGYRQFYKQSSDIEGAKGFLNERLQKNDSIIFIAYIDEKPVGFMQLYHLFSSVSMRPMYLLNDLYVHADNRGKGIGEALINEAKKTAIANQQKGIAIQTAYDNPAQDLYQRLGFEKDTDLHFFWTNT
ncbi:MAG: N-acetyltransferase [Winogradskyella sp.]|uniref:GNAT family N-acetyltransferase n=1 Tax=Winogradskyella sp. TaxID=1883156 RepID=UPI000F3DF6F8|nr:GNAT family N-acetyltransferase [Winogradskyella sp.]RNC79785.1 MAG: N-acetyltransferase [Winogradskyella sp.]